MRPFLFLLLLTCTATAADTVDTVNAKLKAGKEVAWVAKDSAHPADKNLAVVFTARAKDAQPAPFPIIISPSTDRDREPSSEDPRPAFTDATLQDGATSAYLQTVENAIVHLGEKRVLGRIQLPDPNDAYFPGRNHHDLDVLWIPKGDGRNLGLLIYGFRWGTCEIMLIETGPRFLQTSIVNQLDAATCKFIGSGALDLEGTPVDKYCINYGLDLFTERLVVDGMLTDGTPRKTIVTDRQPLNVLNAEAKAGSANVVKLAFFATVPKSSTAPTLEGILTLRLETDKRDLSAKVLKVEAVTPPQ